MFIWFLVYLAITFFSSSGSLSSEFGIARISFNGTYRIDFQFYATLHLLYVQNIHFTLHFRNTSVSNRELNCSGSLDQQIAP